MDQQLEVSKFKEKDKDFKDMIYFINKPIIQPRKAREIVAKLSARWAAL